MITDNIIEGEVNSLPFPAVIEQPHIRNLIYNAVLNDRLTHGFLFSGQSGTGRMAMALELARVINCDLPPSESAGVDCNCGSCRLIRTINHPNLTFIFPRAKELDTKKNEVDAVMIENLERLRNDKYAPFKTSKTGIIRVEQIRELRRSMSLSADRKGVRVAIIKPAENMNANASNALLKLLEEPPERCCLILIAGSARLMLPTIISRCQLLNFSPLSTEAVAKNLRAKHGLSQNDADLIANLASGGLSVAKSMINEDYQVVISESLDFLRVSVQGQAARISKIADAWSRSGAKSSVLRHLDYTSNWVRDALLIKSSQENSDPNITVTASDRIQVSAKLANKYTYNQLSGAWSEIETARQSIMANGIPQLVLTSLALKIGRHMK